MSKSSSSQKTFSREAQSLQATFTDWSIEDLQALLEEVDFDVDTAAYRILDGHAHKWTETNVKKPKPKSSQTLADTSSKSKDSNHPNSSDHSTPRGRGRGSFRGGRGGFRGGRGRGNGRQPRQPRSDQKWNNNASSNRNHNNDHTGDAAPADDATDSNNYSSSWGNSYNDSWGQTDNTASKSEQTTSDDQNGGDANQEFASSAPQKPVTTGAWSKGKPQASQKNVSKPTSQPPQQPVKKTETSPSKSSVNASSSKPESTRPAQSPAKPVTSWAAIAASHKQPKPAPQAQPAPVKERSPSPKRTPASSKEEQPPQQPSSPKQRSLSPQRSPQPAAATVATDATTARGRSPSPAPLKSPSQRSTRSASASPSRKPAASVSNVTEPEPPRAPSPARTKSPVMKATQIPSHPPGFSQQTPVAQAAATRHKSPLPASNAERGRSVVKPDAPVVMPGSVALSSVGVKFGSLSIGESNTESVEESLKEETKAESVSPFQPQQRTQATSQFPNAPGTSLPAPSAPYYNAEGLSKQDHAQSHGYANPSATAADTMNPYLSYQHGGMPGAAGGFGMGAPMTLPGEPYATVYGAAPDRLMGYYADPSNYAQTPARDTKYSGSDSTAPASTSATTSNQTAAQPGAQHPQQTYPHQIPGVPYGYYPYQYYGQFPSYQSSAYQPFVNKNMYHMYAAPNMMPSGNKGPSSYNMYSNQSYEDPVNTSAQGHHVQALSSMSTQEFSKGQGNASQGSATSHNQTASSTNTPHQQNFQSFLGLGSGLNSSHPQSQASSKQANDPLAFGSSQKSYPTSGASASNQSPAQPNYYGNNNYYQNHQHQSNYHHHQHQHQQHQHQNQHQQHQHQHQQHQHQHHMQQSQQGHYNIGRSQNYGWNQS